MGAAHASGEKQAPLSKIDFLVRPFYAALSRDSSRGALKLLFYLDYIWRTGLSCLAVASCPIFSGLKPSGNHPG